MVAELPPREVRLQSATKDRAVRVLTDEYESLKMTVTRSLDSKLKRMQITLDKSELDGYYNHAWHAVYRRLIDGLPITNRSGLLVEIAFRAAIDDLRRSQPGTVSVGLEEHTALAAVDNDLDAQLDSRSELKQVIAGMRNEFSEPELKAAALCYLYGRTRPEAASMMGLSASRMKRLMDAVAPRMTQMLGTLKDGSWCHENQGLISSFAIGALEVDGTPYKVAEMHVSGCHSCRHRVLAMRNFAAVVHPLPLLAAFKGLLLTGGLAIGSGGSWFTALPKKFLDRTKNNPAAVAGVLLVLGGGTAFAATSGKDDGQSASSSSKVSGAAAGASGSGAGGNGSGADGSGGPSASGESPAAREQVSATNSKADSMVPASASAAKEAKSSAVIGAATSPKSSSSSSSGTVSKRPSKGAAGAFESANKAITAAREANRKAGRVKPIAPPVVVTQPQPLPGPTQPGGQIPGPGDGKQFPPGPIQPGDGLNGPGTGGGLQPGGTITVPVV